MNASVTTRLSELGSPARDAQSVGSRDVAEILETELSDEALMAGVCEGNMEALASLFRRHARTVRVVSYRVLRDSCEADDMVHEVFLLVHHHCKKFDSSRGSARFWILQMAYRRAISRRRYLTCRHFYTRLDLDDTASEFADPRTSVSQLEDLIDGRLGNGGLGRVTAVAMRIAEARDSSI
jgi:DNA-directed RNA polymerase specialized sigma24 family protein